MPQHPAMRVPHISARWRHSSAVGPVRGRCGQAPPSDLPSAPRATLGRPGRPGGRGASQQPLLAVPKEGRDLADPGPPCPIGPIGAVTRGVLIAPRAPCQVVGPGTEPRGRAEPGDAPRASGTPPGPGDARSRPTSGAEPPPELGRGGDPWDHRISTRKTTMARPPTPPRPGRQRLCPAQGRPGPSLPRLHRLVNLVSTDLTNREI